MHILEALLGLVALALVAAAVAKRLRTPAPTLLVLTGLGIGMLPGVPAFRVSTDLITFGVLPPLLFAAAQQVSLVELRQLWRTVAVLAVGLVAVTAVAVAFVTHAVDGSVQLATAFTLGAILASTDPVAVAALSRELRLPDRVSTLVQAESLFNDATSLVLFQVAVTAVTSSGVSAGSTVWQFVRLGVGGAVVGAVVGALAAALLRRTDEPTLQAAVALVTPYAAAVAAAALSTSLVTGVIVSGLMIARRRRHAFEPAGRLVARGVYDTITFLLENGVFAVIGLELATFVRELPHGDGQRAGLLIPVVTAVLLAVRGLGLAAGTLVRHWRRKSAAEELPWRTAAVVTWSGARGVIPLVAALSIPVTSRHGAPFPHRPLLLVVTTAAVVITVVVQGGTLRPLVDRLGVVGDAAQAETERARAAHSMANAALVRLADVAASLDAPDDVVERMREELQRRAERSRVQAGEDGRDPAAGRALHRRVLEVQGEELARLRTRGEISAEVYHDLQRQLDLEAAQLHY